jgi:hypothetical protein
MDIETVKRWVVAVMAIHIGGSPALALAFYGPHFAETKRSSGIGLWVMSGVVGLVTVGGVLLIHRKSLLSPWMILGVLPMGIGGFWLF